MTRIKLTSLVFMAVAAMSAVWASSALATEPLLRTEEGRPVSLKGEQTMTFNDALTVDGSTVKCKQITYKSLSNEVADGVTYMFLHPEYSECEAFGSAEAVVTTTNCNYKVMAAGSETVNMFFNTGELIVECGATPININAGNCSASIASQTISKGIYFSNTTTTPTNPGAFDLHLTSAPFIVKKNIDGTGCPLSGTGNTTGNYTGTANMRCFVFGNVQKECYIRNGGLGSGSESGFTLKGEQPSSFNDKLEVDGSNVECESITYSPLGKTPDGATNLRVHPVYSGCKAFGFVSATVTTTDCNYLFMPEGTEDEKMFFNAGEFKVECDAGRTINIDAGTCSASIGPQTVTTGIEFSNTTNSPGEFDIHTTGSPVTVTKNVDGFFCSFSGTGNTTGTYTATARVRCFEGNTQKGCYIRGNSELDVE